jgi:hypothetical protein
MGARVNFIFDDGTNSLVVLYSHWGADSIVSDLQSAFAHAEPRKGDYSYWTRMVISHLIQSELLEETGFGIFAINRSEMASLDNWAENVVIDCTTASFEYNGVYA